MCVAGKQDRGRDDSKMMAVFFRPCFTFHIMAASLAAIVALSVGSLSAQTGQQGTDALLDDVERAVAEERDERDLLDARASALTRELRQISEQLVATAAEVRRHEASIARLEFRVASLERLEAEKSRGLLRQRADFAEILGALERLARFPPEAMIAQPSHPADTVRTAILLRALVPAIERRAAHVRREIESLAQAREEAGQRRQVLLAARQMLADETATLNGLMAEKKRLKSLTDAQRKAADERLAMLQGEAQSLRDLMIRLDAERERQAVEAGENQQQPGSVTARAVPDDNPITARQGQLPMPAVGVLVGRYGEINDNGVALRGIRIATRHDAQVIAPHGGITVYAGRFRGYGQLLIIEHGEGYHTLLAGMARIDSEMGQRVLSGEPVGVMGRATVGQPVLYVELRRGGRPVNPRRWIAAKESVPQG